MNCRLHRSRNEDADRIILVASAHGFAASCERGTGNVIIEIPATTIYGERITVTDRVDSMNELYAALGY